MYCILNVHHDTGDNSTHWLHASSTNYKKNQAKFEGLWKQIAEEFKDYDQHLLFEGYNEMLDDNNTWNEPSNKTDGYKAINDYAKSFVTTVRNTGGNNKDRNLIVNTYSASSKPDAMKNLDLPEEGNHIIFQVHSYPDWQNKSNAKKEIDNLISNIKSNLLNRAPVIKLVSVLAIGWVCLMVYIVLNPPSIRLILLRHSSKPIMAVPMDISILFMMLRKELLLLKARRYWNGDKA